MSKLLKEAIADAKAVRETALANARLALEEAFAPRLQSMLTKKLKEEELEGADSEEHSDDVEEGSYLEDDEVEIEDEVADEEPAVEAPEEEELSDEAPVEEPDAEEEVYDEEEVAADEDELEDGGYSDEDEEEAVEEDTFDLDSIIKELEEEMASDEDEVEEVEEASCAKHEEDEDEPVEEQSDSSEIGKSDNHVDVADCKDCEDPQGSSLTEEEDAEKDTEEEAEELDEEIDIEIVEEEASEDEGEEEEAVEESVEDSEDEKDEEINLEEILKELEEESLEDDTEDESYSEIEELKVSNTKLQKENEEYRKVYKYLRGKLNEVNLLNAKLLYTNKLFKQHVLTEDQKLKVVESFDLTKNVREAKLVYATLGESFRSSNIKEVAPVAKSKAPSTKKSLTEGMASKPIKSTKPSKKILSEGNDLADRFKKLAGIV
jgi:hypothetical protein